VGVVGVVVVVTAAAALVAVVWLGAPPGAVTRSWRK
jgi:hypothetical protein